MTEQIVGKCSTDVEKTLAEYRLMAIVYTAHTGYDDCMMKDFVIERVKIGFMCEQSAESQYLIVAGLSQINSTSPKEITFSEITKIQKNRIIKIHELPTIEME